MPANKKLTTRSVFLHYCTTGKFLSSHAKTNMEILLHCELLPGPEDITDTFPPWTILLRRIKHLTSSCTFSAFLPTRINQLSHICHKLLSMQLLRWWTKVTFWLILRQKNVTNQNEYNRDCVMRNQQCQKSGFFSWTSEILV